MMKTYGYIDAIKMAESRNRRSNLPQMVCEIGMTAQYRVMSFGKPCPSEWIPVQVFDKSSGHAMIHRFSREKLETELGKKTETWINSEKGEKAIQDALEQSLKMIDNIRRERQIDPADLHKPFTI